MAGTENQKMRLVCVAEILLRNTDRTHYLSVNDIRGQLGAYEHSASRQTIYRDFSDIESLGYTVSSHKNGNDVMYCIENRPFTFAEIKMIIEAVGSCRTITENISRKLINKIKKHLCSKYEADSLQQQVHVQGRPKSMNESVLENVDVLHNAIANGCQVEFQYCDFDINKRLIPKYGGKIYRISPWHLIWADDNYYFIGYDSNPRLGQDNIKHYRVDKIVNPKVVNIPREGRKRFMAINLTDYAKEKFGMYGGNVEMVTLRFINEKVGILIDRFGKDVVIKRYDHDRSEIRIPIAISPQFFGWITGIGEYVEIAKPESVRDRYCTYIKLVAEKYDI